MFAVSPAFAVTIYVDIGQTVNPSDGLSLATAWTNITSGATHLAATNATVQGGHTVLVAAGTYVETVALAAGHSGAPGNNNVFLANGLVTVNGGSSCFDLNDTDHVTVDGFYIYNGSHPGGIYIHNGSTDLIIQNCDIFWPGNHGVYVINGTAGNNCIVRRCTMVGANRSAVENRQGVNFLVQNCNLLFNGTSGVHAYGGSTVVRNCIIAGNGVYGIRKDYGQGLTGAYNCVYANAMGNVFVYQSNAVFDTEQEINSLRGATTCSNNIVANPNLSDISDNWNVNEFFTNSPCLDAGEGGIDIGRYQDPPTVGTSTNVYHVDTGIGNDGRTPAQAQNPLTPWQTIAKAVSIADAGNTVIVNAGTYTESVIITNSGSAGLPVTYRANGNVIVTNNVGGKGTIRMDRVANVVFDGFRMHGGYAYNASGFQLEYCYDCIVTNGECRGYTGHPAWTSGGVNLTRSPCNAVRNMVLYCNLVGLVATRGAGGIVEGCNIYSNYAGVYHTCVGRNIQNCSIHNNQRCGFYIYNEDGVTSAVINCVMVGNLTNAVLSGSKNNPLRVENCVLMGSEYGVREGGGAGDVVVAYCCFWNNSTNMLDETTTPLQTAGEINAVANCCSNIVVDPKFRTPAINDFRLAGGSPCINAGSPATELSWDFFGNPRLVGSAVDIGIYEMPPPGLVWVFW